MSAVAVDRVQLLKIQVHKLGGNTSGLLWWYSDLDLNCSTQRSNQLLLTSQLVSFISPNRCTPIGAPITSQVFDLGLETTDNTPTKSSELILPVSISDLTPRTRILMVLRNKRPTQKESEIVAIHLLKLFSGEESDAPLLCGTFHLQLLNIAHPQDSLAQIQVDNEADFFLRIPHIFNRQIPESLWHLIATCPESMYSTASRAVQPRIASLEKLSEWRDHVWLSVTLNGPIFSGFARPHPDLLSLSKRTSPSASTTFIATRSLEESLISAPAELKVDHDDQLPLATIDESTLDNNLGDRWDPNWKNPAQAKHDAQMGRLAAQDSWDITPSASDAQALEKIMHAFASWTPLSESDQLMVWKYRGHLKRIGAPLFLFASSVPWSSPKFATDAMRLIEGTLHLTTTTPPPTFAAGNSSTYTTPGTTSTTPLGSSYLAKSKAHDAQSLAAAYGGSSSLKFKSLKPSPSGAPGSSPAMNLPSRITPGSSNHSTAQTPHTPYTAPTERHHQPMGSSSAASTPSGVSSPTVDRFTAATTSSSKGIPHSPTARRPYTTQTEGLDSSITPPLPVSTDLPFTPVQSQSRQAEQASGGVSTTPTTQTPTQTQISSSSSASKQTSSTSSGKLSSLNRAPSDFNGSRRSNSVSGLGALRSMDAPWPCNPIESLPMLTWRHVPDLRRFIINKVLYHAELEPFILQLIQGLRYEAKPKPNTFNSPFGRTPLNYEYVGSMGNGSYNHTPTSSSEIPRSWSEAPEETDHPLLDLLCSRATTTPLAYYIYWYLAADETLRPQFDALCEKLRASAIWQFLEKQGMIHKALQRIGSECPELPADLRRAHIENIARDCCLMEQDMKHTDLSLAPHLKFQSLNASSFRQLKSANKPFILALEVAELVRPVRSASSATLANTALSNSVFAASTAPSSTPTKNSTTGDTQSTPSPDLLASSVTSPLGRSSTLGSSVASPSGRTVTEKKNYEIIYKKGDDMRQDQLVMVLIRLIDKELKTSGLDLKFIIYEVLALSNNDGFMRCVPGCEPVAEIVKQGNTISAYLKAKNPTAEKYEEALDNYVRSCAGYCVLNMVLGWGDRHLHNVLLTADGHLFHIDFGFILGKDANWSMFATTLRLDDRMLEPMGGEGGREREKFVRFAVTAYLTLRKFGGRILSLLYIMRDAGLGNLTSNRDIDFVRDRLNLGFSDAEAQVRLQEALEKAPRSLGQRTQDFLRSFKY